jgi:hypothetical protein
MRTQVISARAAALFTSDLPSGSTPSAYDVAAAIAHAIHVCGGSRGCVAEMAMAYGDCPETAAPRMRWARGVVLTVYGPERTDLALAA